MEEETSSPLLSRIVTSMPGISENSEMTFMSTTDTGNNNYQYENLAKTSASNGGLFLSGVQDDDQGQRDNNQNAGNVEKQHKVSGIIHNYSLDNVNPNSQAVKEKDNPTKNNLKSKDLEISGSIKIDAKNTCAMSKATEASASGLLNLEKDNIVGEINYSNRLPGKSNGDSDNSVKMETIGNVLEICCGHCGSKDFVKRGTRKKKMETVQLYLCRTCGRTFTPRAIKGNVKLSSPEITAKFFGSSFITSIICAIFPDASLTPTMLECSLASLAKVEVSILIPVLP